MNSSSRWRRLLLPLTPLYHFGLVLRASRLASGREPIRLLRFPVISIGNLSTGGAGKTPLAISMAQALTLRGLAVDVLSRGYGRRSQVAARVDPTGVADKFGDEPLLIARQAGVPVYVARQRYDAGVLAESKFPYPGPASPRVVHILDDGFQHRQLHRDINILLLNWADWLDHLLPSGNLREPLQAIERADVIAIPAIEPELEAELRNRGWEGPIWRLHRHMEIPPIDGRAFAFCGIARPQQFFAGLEAAGLHFSGRRTFSDHHRYAAQDLDRLATEARLAGASTLLTTEKDEVRLAGLTSPLPIASVSLRIEIEDHPTSLDWIINRLKLIRKD